MKSYVVDTSSMLRLFIPDGDIPGGLDLLLDKAENLDAIIFVPDLFYAEAAQVIYKKAKAEVINVSEAKELVELVLKLPLVTLAHKDFIRLAFKMSIENNITIYDSLFLSIAISKGCPLISSDDKLLKAAKKTGIETVR